MKKIINKNNKRLIFPEYDFAIDANEIKKVDDTLAEILLCNVNIEEIIPVKRVKKGRKNY